MPMTNFEVLDDLAACFRAQNELLRPWEDHPFWSDASLEEGSVRRRIKVVTNTDWHEDRRLELVAFEAANGTELVEFWQNEGVFVNLLSMAEGRRPAVDDLLDRHGATQQERSTVARLIPASLAADGVFRTELAAV